MKIKSLLFFLLIFLVVFSCRKETEEIIINEIVFGVVGSNCASDCRELYLLTREAIYADDGEANGLELPWNETVFEEIPLDEDKFVVAKVLLELPSELTNSSVSSPYFEQGFFPNIYLEIRQKGKIWQFQALAVDTPGEIKDYFAEMASVLQELKR